MTNVIAFRPAIKVSQKDTLRSLIKGVCQHRHGPDDVFWLKENAELLGVLAATGAELQAGDLAPYEKFYDMVEEKLRFYPQYYRFFLSICLDLEDLGLDGCKGEALCRWAALTGLADAELSDLQRAEARRLLSRRGGAPDVGEGPLGDRLRQFAAREATFALPNKKAAYELTHIVYYLADYGRRDPGLSDAALVSLEYAGVLAYLDQNHDLLAEVATAMRFAGATPHALWDEAIDAAHRRITPVSEEALRPSTDAYHAYLVTGWAQKLAGQPGFEAPVPEGPLGFAAGETAGSALRPLSECLFDLGPGRTGDWSGMRQHVLPCLSVENRAILQQAEASTDRFDAFFEGFARARNNWPRRAG